MTDDRSYHGGAGEAFATRVNAPGLSSLHERPAVLELIGDVDGQRIADLGCGAGNYLLELAQRGAQVTGVDGSETLVAHASSAAGPGARVIHHNLEQPMAFLDDHSQDGVLCALVLHHLSDRHRFLGEVHRILRPGGWLVVSSTHPTADWGRFGGSYFDERWITRPLNDQHSIEYQLIPLNILINELINAGFVLDKMIEPQPSPELRQADPQRYEELRAAPVFLALRLHT